MVQIFSSHPFYGKFVRLPSADDPVPEFISGNSRFYPFFKDALGALDCTHFPFTFPKAERQISRDRKGESTQNFLAACDFDLLFRYLVSGWEGSTSDSNVFLDSRMTDLVIPPGKYYLADAGFPNCNGLLTPYRGQRFNLKESGPANLKYLN